MAQAEKQREKKRTAVRSKKSFHHGDLREALIAATRELLIEHGPDGFTLADACRRAGVTTAAPYKHFRDKQEIIEEIVARGFDQLLTAPVDCVRLPGDLRALLARPPAFLASQPVIGLWPVAALSELRAILEADGDLAVRAFARRIGARAVTSDFVPPNVNSAADLDRLADGAS